MKWVKYLSDTKSAKTGECLQVEDGVADALISNGIAEATAAPIEVASAVTELKGSLAEFVKSTVAEGFASLRADLKPITRTNPAAGAGTTVTVSDHVDMPRYGSLRNFPNTDEGRRKAYRFGVYCLANYAQFGRIQDPERQEFANRYVRIAKQIGVILKKDIDDAPSLVVEKQFGTENVVQRATPQSEGTNQYGGFLVPDEFQNDMIDLREQYGVFRRNAKIVPMISDTRSDPRRKGGLTAYFVGEDAAATQSTKNWDRVRLTAKKVAILVKYSNELSEDAVINIGDDLAGEAAYAFANLEDNCGFNGDGTQGSYGGIVGARQALLNLTGTIGNILGLQVASGTGYATSYGSIVLGDFSGVIARLPEYADTTGAKWYVSKNFWANTMQRLAMAAGGNRVENIQGGALTKMFAGYPVEVSQVMPKVSAVSQVVALFGNLAKAASFGDRRKFTVSMSDSALNAFEQDEMAMRCTERFDINVHDVGEITGGTARDPVQGLVAGPLVGLITAAL